MHRAVLLLSTSICAFAQFDGLTGSASRTVTLPADEVSFSVALTVDAATTLDQAAAMLKDTGVTANDLTNISSSPYYQGGSDGAGPARLTYYFDWVRPFVEMKNVLGKLEALRKAATDSGGELQFGLSVGPSESTVEQTRQKILPELLAEARKNAEFLARASQMTLGPIQTVGDYAPGLAFAGGWAGGGYGPHRTHLVRVTFSVYARWAAKAQ
jgi:uncharacterized protein YggE